MLEERYVMAQSALHEQFVLQWKYLVKVDQEVQSVTITAKNPGGGLNLDNVFQAMQAFGDTDKLMKELADDLRQAIFEPRFKLTKGELPLFEFQEVSAVIKYLKR